MDTETRQRLDSMQAQINKPNGDVARLTEALDRLRQGREDWTQTWSEPRRWLEDT